MSAPSSSSAQEPATVEAQAENTTTSTALAPIIPGAVEFKYYHAPDGFKRLRTKRKVALLFGYIGERYCGLQWNHLPDYPTVEEAILKAMYETDMISLANFSQFKVQQLLNFERASRTDRGVHALRNLISVAAMLPYEPTYVETYQPQMHALQAKQSAFRAEHDQARGDVEDTTAATEVESSAPTTTTTTTKAAHVHAPTAADMGIPPAEFSCEEAKKLLNEALPDDIHVYRVEPVTRSFNAYMCCGGRRYEYYIPTFAFMPRDAYVNTYFPESLAPAMPSLKETGFVPRSSRPQFFKGPGQGSGVVDDAQAVKKKKKKNDKLHKSRQEDDEDGEGPVSFRKSRGHFPKTKKRRLEEKARLEAEAAREAAAAAALAATSTEDVATDVQASVLSASAKAANDDQAEEEEEEEEDVEDVEDVEEEAELDENGKPKPIDWSKHFATHFSDNIFETMMTFRSIPEEAMRHVASYRLPSPQLEQVRKHFAQYEGTHCFHNFTPGGSSRDASCHRYIPAITVSEPMVWSPSDPLVQVSIDAWAPSRFFTADDRVAEGFSARLMAMEKDEGTTMATEEAEEGAEAPSRAERTFTAADLTPEEVAHLRHEMKAHMARVYGSEGIEVVRIELQGQSFMLNQIRKMIGAVACLCACDLPPSHIREHLLHKHVRCGIPMAPANGLFLSTLDFSGYNSRLKRIQQDGGNGGNKDGIDMDALIDTAELEEERRRITAVVLRNEMVEDLVGKWMRSLRHVVHLAWKVDLP